MIRMLQPLLKSILKDGFRNGKDRASRKKEREKHSEEPKEMYLEKQYQYSLQLIIKYRNQKQKDFNY